MGIARLGAVSVSINPAYQIPEIEYCINKVGMKAIVTTENFKTQRYHEMLSEIFPELQAGQTKIDNENYPTMKRIIVDSNKRLRFV